EHVLTQHSGAAEAQLQLTGVDRRRHPVAEGSEDVAPQPDGGGHEQQEARAPLERGGQRAEDGAGGEAGRGVQCERDEALTGVATRQEASGRHGGRPEGVVAVAGTASTLPDEPGLTAKRDAKAGPRRAPLSQTLIFRGTDWSVDLDEDALAGALLGGLDGGLFLTGGDRGDALGATRVGEDLVAVLHVGQPVVEKGEHGWCDLLAQSVAGAEILVDPDLHGGATSRWDLVVRSPYRAGELTRQLSRKWLALIPDRPGVGSAQAWE